MSNVYTIVTNRIIEKLEAGVVPWKQPWIHGLAVNWMTQRPYQGINCFLLNPGEYATFKQISEAGGKVKKGEKSKIIVYWNWIEKENDDGETVSIPILRYYNVFEINTQVEGLESKRKKVIHHDPIEEAENLIKNIKNHPRYTFNSGKAYYQPLDDTVNVPPIHDFEIVEEYYSTLFHELIHATGHETRLNREGINSLAAFGSEVYSKEELIAELGSAMLCAIVGIDNSTIDNSASYINGWLQALKGDKRLIILAAAQAQKAVNYLINENLN